jgi:hypothetical protein
VNYVDAGYAVALGSLGAYALALALRRRRWERALKTVRTETPTPATAADDPAGPASGARP